MMSVFLFQGDLRRAEVLRFRDFISIYKGGKQAMYDVTIIGAGVSGAAAARELSRYEASICLVEKGEDVCSGQQRHCPRRL